jgi:hypothetical protein
LRPTAAIGYLAAVSQVAAKKLPDLNLSQPVESSRIASNPEFLDRADNFPDHLF